MNNSVLSPSQILLGSSDNTVSEWFLHRTRGLCMFNREGFNIGNWAYEIIRRIEGVTTRLVLQEQTLDLDLTHQGNAYL